MKGGVRLCATGAYVVTAMGAQLSDLAFPLA